MDRLVRSRAWVVIVGIGLIGIVAMQVSMLKLNSGIGRAVDTVATLERSNASLKAEVSRLSSGDRIQTLAGQRGFLMPEPADVTYLRAGDKRSDGFRAARRMRAPDPAIAGPAGAVIAIPDALTVAAADTTGDPAGVAGTAAATTGTAVPATTTAPTTAHGARHRHGPRDPARDERDRGGLRAHDRAARDGRHRRGDPRADRAPGHLRRRGDDPIVGLTERRIGLLFAIFLALLLIAASRAAWLGAVKGESLQAVASTQQVEVLKVPAGRGAITDRNGIELAVSEPADDIAATPYLIKKPLTVARRLAPLLDTTEGKLLAKFEQKGGFVYLARNLPGTQSAKIKKLEIAGLQFIPSSRREYPRKWMASQVLGWVGTDGEGLAGLEYAKDEILRGSDGERRIVKDALGEPIVLQETKRAERGKDLRLTLDAELQGKVENVLAEVGLAWRPKGATALVMDPYSNTILALANWPRVDANDRAGAPDYAAQNRAVGFNYEPGSTFKPFTVAGALEEKAVSPTDIFHLPPTIDVADRTIKEAHDRGTVDLSVTRDPRAVQQRRHGAHRPAPRPDALRPLGAALRLRPQDRHRAARRGGRPGAQARGSTPARRWATCRSARASRSRRCSSRRPTRRSPTAGSCAGRGSSPRSTASGRRCRAAGASSRRRPPRGCARCSRASSRPAAAPARWRSPATRWRARPARRTRSTARPASTPRRASSPRSSASRRRASPSCS